MDAFIGMDWLPYKHDQTVVGCESAAIVLEAIVETGEEFLARPSNQARAQELDSNSVTVTVQNADGPVQAGWPVYVYDGETQLSDGAYTDENGQVIFTLEEGSYRFVTEIYGHTYASSAENGCTVPGCDSAVIDPPRFGTVAVEALEGGGSHHYGEIVAFDEEGNWVASAETGYGSGVAWLTLPEGSYRFGISIAAQWFYSSEGADCDVPGCESAVIQLPVFNYGEATVRDSAGVAKEGVYVELYRGDESTGIGDYTNINGLVYFWLPEGEYRFQAEYEGQSYWNEGTCAVPECETVITLPQFGDVAVTVTDREETPLAGILVSAYQGGENTWNSVETNEAGQAVLHLAEGRYRFQAEYEGQMYWSGVGDHCQVPGCSTVTMQVGPGADNRQTVNYTYDPLNRLTAAEYADGRSFDYSYDAAGNRLSETALTIPGQDPLTNTYSYDDANRLSAVNGVAYTWDANGNLLSDGAATYTYDDANRLASVSNAQGMVQYAYNGLGDRLSQTMNGSKTVYRLDLTTGLTQVLDDGQRTYLYGNGRIGYTAEDAPFYYLGDALGSVREVVQGDTEPQVMMMRDYEPYGEVLAQQGGDASGIGYTGEMFDTQTGLVFLRARYYSDRIPIIGLRKK